MKKEEKIFYLADLVKQMRKATGLKQEDFAKLYEVSRTSVSMWEGSKVSHIPFDLAVDLIRFNQGEAFGSKREEKMAMGKLSKIKKIILED